MIRKVYSNLAGKLIRQKSIAMLARISSQLLLIKASSIIGIPLCGPLLGILVVTYRCNQRCLYCDMQNIARSQADKAIDELDKESLCAIIDEFARLGVKAIAFTGGEPLLREDIYELISYVKKRGMLCQLSTNGILVSSAVAAKLISSGLDSVCVSIDGSNAQVHGRIRKGKEGFAQAHNALRHLLEVRDQLQAKTRIKILTVVSKYNVDDIHNIITDSRRIGVDGIELMPCQPLLDGTHGVDFIYDSDFHYRVARLIDEITDNKGEREIIDNSSTHLQLFRSAFAGEPFPFSCYAAYASLVVDCYGSVYPCLPWANWRYMPISLAGQTLAEIWKSKKYGSVRVKANDCSRCYLNCQAELSILLDLAKIPTKNK